MIYKMPKVKDPFKEQIEKIKKEIKKQNLPPENIEEQQERFKKLEEESLPKLESDIVKLIENIKQDLLSCNPQQTLDYFSLIYSITTSDKVIENAGNLNNSYLDFLLSIMTSLDIQNYNLDNASTKEVLSKIQSNIEELHQQLIYYFMITSTNKDKTPDDMKFLQALGYLTIKGDSYPKHKIQLCRELFSKYDELLMNNYKINSKQLIDELVKIANTPLSNMEIQKKYILEMKKAHNEYVKNSELAEKEGKLKEFFDDYKESAELKQTHDNLQQIEKDTKVSFHDSIFKIHDTLLSTEILEQLSLTLGSNNIFQNGKIEYFPMNESLIYKKPLVKIDEDFFCFNSPTMNYNLDLIIENLILNLIPQNKQSKQYYSKKGDYLEDISLELFQSILPNAQVYKGLKYNIDDEVDGIIIYDNNIFIIEAKSNNLTIGAKKGNTDKIKRNTKDIVEKAYQQAIRAKSYIESNDFSDFRDKNKKVILAIDKSKINNIYMINTTLEPLMHITANLNSLKRFGFVQGKDWIWSVYINDLRIISEIIDSPAEFLLYLERRIKFNDYPQIRTLEEIDIFGHFLHNGIYYDDIDFPEQHYMMVTDGFSQPIDEYYLSIDGSLEKEIPKPSFLNKCKTKKIVKKIETTNKENSTILSKFLMSYDEQHQLEIDKQVSNILNKQRKNFSMSLNSENKGFTFIHDSYENKKDMEFYCKVMSYEHKINNWFLIFVDGLTPDNLKLDFKYFYFDNKYDEVLEKEVCELRGRRLLQTATIVKKVGRNEPCPCGSGKKYKKCCI